jgi:KaiC/GvpD/RAD55 family RecA-like ATPase
MKTKRIKMQLPNSKYFVVAEINETMPNHQEIDIVIEDKNGVVIQDIVRVEPTVVRANMDYTEHDKDVLTVYLYEDEYDEDYTKQAHIRVYKDHEENSNI